jgi:hypothetical protein
LNILNIKFNLSNLKRAVDHNLERLSIGRVIRNSGRQKGLDDLELDSVVIDNILAVLDDVTDRLRRMNPEVDEGVSLTRNDVNFHSACHDGDGLKKKGRD